MLGHWPLLVSRNVKVYMKWQNLFLVTDVTIFSGSQVFSCVLISSLGVEYGVKQLKRYIIKRLGIWMEIDKDNKGYGLVGQRREIVAQFARVFYLMEFYVLFHLCEVKLVLLVKNRINKQTSNLPDLAFQCIEVMSNFSGHQNRSTTSA